MGIPDLRPGFLLCSLGGISTPSCVLISQQKPIYAKGFPGGASGKESACQCRRGRRLRFHPQVGKIPWRRGWQPAPVFLPGESHGHRSLAGYSPWGHKESDTTERTCIRGFPPVRNDLLAKAEQGLLPSSLVRVSTPQALGRGLITGCWHPGNKANQF